jgi:hypothetical protein
MKKSVLMIMAAGLLLSLSSSAQNVGIGISTPAQKLDVNGTARVRSLTTNGVVTNNASGDLGTLAGTTTTVLHGNASGLPTFGAVALTSDVSGTLPVGNGGTGTSTTFTQGSVIFAGASGVFSQNNANLFWDNTNNRLGIGTPSPATVFHATSAISSTSYFVANNATVYTENTNANGSTLVAKNSAASSTGDGDAIEATTAQSGAFGIWGQNTNASGAGIVGAGGGAGSNYSSGAGGCFTGPGTGVIGFASTVASGNGVIGLGNGITSQTTLGSGSGGTFNGVTTGLVAYNSSLGTSQAIYSSNAGVVVRVAYYNGTTQYKINGTGTVSTIAKDINDVPVTLHCPETPEIYFQDFGTGKLTNGKAHIDLDPSFAKNITVNAQHPLRVYIQVEGNCKGVYVTGKSQNGFDVTELDNGTSNIDFQWFVTGNRADEVLDNGRISHNADMRFEPARAPETTVVTEAKVRKEKGDKK